MDLLLRCFDRRRRSIARKIYQLIQRRIIKPVEEEEDNYDDDASNSSPWDSLPDIAVDKIFANLCIRDRIRMRTVCKSWRSTLTRRDIPFAPEAPWLIVPGKGGFLSEIRLTSTADKKTHRFTLPPQLPSIRKPITRREKKDGYWCCCGSSGGWLLVAVGTHMRHVDMLLWDPLSGAVRDLPPLSTLSFFVDRIVPLEHLNASAVVRRMRVLPSPIDGRAAVAVLLQRPFEEACEQLAICGPDDRAWRPVGGPKPCGFYQDICFHKGKMYAACMDHGDGNIEANPGPLSEISRHRVSLAGFDRDGFDAVLLLVRGEEVHGPLVEHDVRYYRPDVGFRVWRRYEWYHHLAECAVTGELLVVTAVKDLCSYRDTTAATAAREGSKGSFVCTQTSRFHVLRLRAKEEENLYEVENVDGGVGGQGVFVGQLGTISMRDNGAEGVNGDLICFATGDSDHSWLEEGDGDLDWADAEETFHVFEQGVYDLRRERIETTGRVRVQFEAGCVTGWFTPKLYLS